MNHEEFSRRGGKSKSPEKMKAILENLAKARLKLKQDREAKKKEQTP